MGAVTDTTSRQTWLDGLPRLVEDTFRHWHLTPAGDPVDGYTARVFPVLDADRVRRACKFSHVEGDNAGEIATLSLWGGRGAVELLRADPRRGVHLMEWLTGDLEEPWDADEATRAVAGLYRCLHRRAAPQLSDGHAFVRRWLADLAGLGRRVPGPPRFVDWALRAGKELAADKGTHIVHGDLHYLNVMYRDGEPVAIDPKGYNAAPEYEVAPLLRCMINLAWVAQNGVAGAGLDDPHEWVTRNVTIVKAMQAVEG